MLHDDDFTGLMQRAKRVGLNLGRLAHDAGLARTTLYKAAAHGNPEQNTIRAVRKALVRRELELRDYLIGLHPIGSADVGRKARAAA